MTRLDRRWLGLAASALVMAMPRAARAANPACSTLTNPIFIESGDTQEPLLKTLGRALRDSAQPMTVVYNTTGSCTLIQDMYTGTPLKVNLKYAPSIAENPNWDPSQPPLTCTNTSQAIDIAISALFVQSCTTQTPPAPLGLVTGPIQGYGFLVPEASTQTAITAEEGYFAFGFGNVGGITPWNDDTYFQVRPNTKSTLLTLAAALLLDPKNWHGHPWDKSTDLLNAVAVSKKPEQTIGIIGVEVYDQNRATTNILAYQAYNQRYAYYPDSSATAFDKRNLRDGHYLPWSPTVYIEPVDGSNIPTNPNAKRFTELVLGTAQGDDVDGLSGVIARGLVPDCAMKVSRTSDGGDLSLYTPKEPCGCYFESKIPNASGAPVGCTACSGDAACGAGKCRHGFCEAQ